MKQHPGIFVPPSLEDKEPAFYSRSWGMKDRNQYLNLFSAASMEQQIGDCSTAHLTDPDSPSLIANDNPKAKIIILLRNPVDRAYSLYNWMLNNGYEPIYPFEKALEAETSRVDDSLFRPEIGYSHNYLYFRSGLYSSQIEAYKAHFPEDQIKVVFLDDIISHREGVMSGICKFLGVNTDFVPKMILKNRGGVPWIPLIQHKLRIGIKKSSGWRKAIGFRFFLVLLIRLNTGRWGTPSITFKTREELLSRYQEEIKALEVLLNRDLEVWKKPSSQRVG